MMNLQLVYRYNLSLSKYENMLVFFLKKKNKIKQKIKQEQNDQK